MKKISVAVFALLILTIGSFGQTATKSDSALEAAMKKFIVSIETKNTKDFLGFISPTKGLTIMNTIDQGEAGNAANPMLDSKLSYKKLSADFKKKGELYKSMFMPSEDSPNFYDAFAKRTEKWTLGADNKFSLAGENDESATDSPFYVKWEMVGKKWYVTEVGRMIS